MCGIFGYLNFLTPKNRREIIDILINGLKRMEYRGYDSAGIAIDGSNNAELPHAEVALLKKVGKVSVLEEYINENEMKLDMNMTYNIHCGIAHTRWATHGSPKDVNAHPQRSNSRNEFLVVHNGIITNYRELKAYLTKKGHAFESETDTEVIAKLIQHIADKYPHYSFRQLVETAIQQLEGAFALAIKSSRFPGQLVACRRGSPLIVGIKSSSMLTTDHIPVFFSKGSNVKDFERYNFLANILEIRVEGPTTVRPFDSQHWEVEYFVASDASAIVEHTKQVIFLEDDDVAVVEGGALTIHRVKRCDSGLQTREVQNLTLELQEIMMGDYKTFMQKEIFEQPESSVNTMRGRLLPDGRVVLGGVKDYLPDIRRCRRLILIACGTSYNSAIACRQTMEELTELPVVLELASDFLDRETPVFRDDVCFFISQSGETADTLMALRFSPSCNVLITALTNSLFPIFARALTIGITNTVGSSISRESHCGIHVNAGPEIGVASTKAYTSQILSLIMFALTMSDDRISLQPRRRQIIDAMKKIPDQIREVLKLDDQVLNIAKRMYKEKSLLVMGRGLNFATCLEGALKIKELTYLHCEGIMSGELKHGPLAMVDSNRSIVMIICSDKVYKKSINALQQVLAREGNPVIVADSEVPEEDLNGRTHVIRVPKTVDCLQGILTVIPLQLLSYHIAELNGLNVDRPRNLAKSVTVE
ncbi:unnamed protein product [Enterobius vermicularis]|uniref:glutamine--fructose-6-phosphate transaminase (isomerizing) n=1 Tax=Enterobius vermicularis TaxID=51028 RepID=A0A0N4VHB4_ENTVE|nr:unnamed protein product [Enterobius vermicularis]